MARGSPDHSTEDGFKMNILASLANLIFDYLNTDFSRVEYQNFGIAVGIGVALLMALGLKWWFGRDRNYRTHSGHSIKPAMRRGLFSRMVYWLPRLIFAVGTLFFLQALAKPVIPQTKERVVVNTRDRLELLDVSGSMGLPYKDRGSKISVAEVVRKSHLEFLKMRRGLNDRVSLWVFSNQPYKLEDFIVDDKVYMMQARNAPYVIVDPQYWMMDSLVAPKRTQRYIQGEGWTDMKKAFDTVLKYLERESHGEVNQKAILFITDAGATGDKYPEEQLKDMREKGINLYMLAIRQSPKVADLSDTKLELENSRRMFRELSKYGGKYYYVEDAKGLDKIFKEINRLESVETEIIKYGTEIQVQQRPLAVGFAFISVALILGLYTELFLGRHP